GSTLRRHRSARRCRPAGEPVRRLGCLAATTVALGCGPGQLAGAGDEAEPAETSTESADESLGESSSTDSTTETETETETGDEDPPMPTLPEACALVRVEGDAVVDRKSTRLNSSHVKSSYAVFCLKKKNKTNVK